MFKSMLFMRTLDKSTIYAAGSNDFLGKDDIQSPIENSLKSNRELARC